MINAYNKSELFKFGLESIKHQNYDKSKFEVVLVDDHSTDNLREMVMNKSLPFQFKYILLPHNMGRPAARNAGIKAAEGNIVILTDADCVLPKTFITNHIKYHTKDKVIVSGAANHLPLYTHYYPEFDNYQKNKIFEIVNDSSSILQKVKSRIKNPNSTYSIINIKDISEGNFDQFCKRTWKGQFYSIRKEFSKDLKNFHGKWMAFACGYSVSAKKNDLVEIGMFDEKFKLYGLEDWELGYRFYEAGYNFLCPNDVYNYHQEHPRNTQKNYQENIINYKIFRDKFKTTQIYLFSLALADWKNWHTENLGKLFSELELIKSSDCIDTVSLLQLIRELAQLFSDVVINNIDNKNASFFYNQLHCYIINEWTVAYYKERLEIVNKFLNSKNINNYPFTKKAINLLFKKRYLNKSILK